MILAAGLGTRLKPITDTLPKALVEIEGVPMLQHVILSLKKQGFDKIIVNVHHFANQIIEFLDTNKFGVDIKISDESDSLLDTGGGIVKAYPLLFNNDDSPVLIHNVDILSNANLKGLMDESNKNTIGSNLLVSDRESSRKLLFNKEMNLCGWHDLKNNKFRLIGDRKKENTSELAFSGIYVVTKDAVEEMKNLCETGSFPIMDYFLNPLRKLPVKGLGQPNLRLLDIGKPATLSQAPSLLNELNTVS